MNSIHKYPYHIYKESYYNRGYAREAFPEFIQIQEGFAAFAYAFGAVENYNELERLIGLENYQSLTFSGNPRNKIYKKFHKEYNPRRDFSFFKDFLADFLDGGDTVYKKGWTILDQIKIVLKNAKRKPKKIVDIGGGLGMLASMFSQCKISSTKVDPMKTREYKLLDQSKLKSYSFISEIEKDLKTYDTVIFCSSMEHLPKDYGFEILGKLAKGTMLIIVNSFDNHPIADIDGTEHITMIDDAYYRKVKEDLGFSVVYQERSHFVGIKK